MFYSIERYEIGFVYTQIFRSTWSDFQFMWKFVITFILLFYFLVSFVLFYTCNYFSVMNSNNKWQSIDECALAHVWISFLFGFEWYYFDIPNSRLIVFFIALIFTLLLLSKYRIVTILRIFMIICPNNETFVFIAGRSVTFLDCNYVDTVTSIIDLSVVSLSGITFFFARKFIYFMSVYIRNISFLEYNFGLSGTLHLSEIYWFAYHYNFY